MELWDFVYSQTAAGEAVMLMVVTDARGSSPGRVGFKMAVTAGGAIAGSVGGGVMEYNMAEHAKRLLHEGVKEITVRRQVHDLTAEHDKSGMICAGEQTIAFIPLSALHTGTLEAIRECIARGERGKLIITESSLSFSKGTFSNITTEVRNQGTAGWEYSEIIGLRETVYIFGAGHISLPLSMIMKMLGFRVVVFDDRRELSTFTSNSYAHHKEVVDYKNVAHLVPEGMDSYVVIMSFGHRSDDIILRQMLSKELGYLGMIGSKSKTGAIFSEFIKEGFSRESVTRVNSPIGISIGSKTPAEISVSIAAKIIEVRNSRS